MKKAFSVIVFLVCFCLVSFAWADPSADSDAVSVQQNGMCPTTKIVGDVDSCLKCHAMSGNKFVLQEFADDAYLDYPVDDLKIEGTTARLVLKSILSDEVAEAIQYIEKHNVNKLILEIHSPGGIVGEAWRIQGYLHEWKSKGNIVETRGYGMCASAGFMVLISGSKGHRLVTPHAMIMWHEIGVTGMQMNQHATPTDKEDEAATLRHMQESANRYISDVSGVGVEIIRQNIKYKTWWMTGREAVEFGFADGLLGE